MSPCSITSKFSPSSVSPAFWNSLAAFCCCLAYGPGPVAFLLSGEMAFAYFLVHAQKSFFPILNQGELAVLYCFVLLYLAVAGGGVWSLTRDKVTPHSI